MSAGSVASCASLRRPALAQAVGEAPLGAHAKAGDVPVAGAEQVLASAVFRGLRASIAAGGAAGTVDFTSWGARNQAIGHADVLAGSACEGDAVAVVAGLADVGSVTDVERVEFARREKRAHRDGCPG